MRQPRRDESTPTSGPLCWRNHLPVARRLAAASGRGRARRADSEL